MSRFDRFFGMAALVVILGASVWFTHWTNQKAADRAEENNRRSEMRQCELIGIEVRFFELNPPLPTDPGRAQRAADYRAIWERHCTKEAN